MIVVALVIIVRSDCKQVVRIHHGVVVVVSLQSLCHSLNLFLVRRHATLSFYTIISFRIIILIIIIMCTWDDDDDALACLLLSRGKLYHVWIVNTLGSTLSLPPLTLPLSLSHDEVTLSISLSHAAMQWNARAVRLLLFSWCLISAADRNATAASSSEGMGRRDVTRRWSFAGCDAAIMLNRLSGGDPPLVSEFLI